MNNNFQYQGERFADIQMLRYQLPGFEALSLNQKLYIYYLSEATLWGRDITFDQFGKYNLLIRSTLEKVYVESIKGKVESGKNTEFNKLSEYLKRVWFSNGIYHHYGCEKFKPEFSQSFFEDIALQSGFSNRMTMHRMYLKVYGITPGDERRNRVKSKVESRK